MKEITLPKELLNLPHPWGITRPEQRRQQIRSLSYDTKSIKTGLNVLERCLHILSELTYNQTNCIPEEMITYWAFSADWLADRIPTFEEFDLVKVEQFLINDEAIEQPSPDLIFDVAEYWLWWMTWDIEKLVLNWVQDALIATREPILISHYLHITKRYWLKIQPRFAQSLLRRSAQIGWQRALPLFDSVEQHPNATEEIKETVRNYREFVLDNPEDWLPDSDTNLEWSDQRGVFVPTQPAHAQLAVV